jgi:phosphoribosylaminoimidazole-succinocarboxamide synthase
VLQERRLGDPLLNWHHFRELGVSDEDLEFCEELGLKVNACLAPFFDERGVTLVTFKIEVGRDGGTVGLMLADEIAPDTCRFWDKETGERLDKDRFDGTSAGWRRPTRRCCDGVTAVSFSSQQPAREGDDEN